MVRVGVRPRPGYFFSGTTSQALERVPAPAERRSSDALSGAARKRIRATRASAGMMCDAPTTRSACSTWGVDLAEVEAELRALPLRPTPSVLELVALEVLRAIEEEPDCFGPVETSIAEYKATVAAKHIEYARLLQEVRDTWPAGRLVFHARGKEANETTLYRINYTMHGKDTGIDIDSVDVLVATYCEKQAIGDAEGVIAGAVTG